MMAAPEMIGDSSNRRHQSLNVAAVGVPQASARSGVIRSTDRPEQRPDRRSPQKNSRASFPRRRFTPRHAAALPRGGADPPAVWAQAERIVLEADGRPCARRPDRCAECAGAARSAVRDGMRCGLWDEGSSLWSGGSCVWGEVSGLWDGRSEGCRERPVGRRGRCVARRDRTKDGRLDFRTLSLPVGGPPVAAAAFPVRESSSRSRAVKLRTAALRPAAIYGEGERCGPAPRVHAPRCRPAAPRARHGPGPAVCAALDAPWEPDRGAPDRGGVNKPMGSFGQRAPQGERAVGHLCVRGRSFCARCLDALARRQGLSPLPSGVSFRPCVSPRCRRE